MTICGKPHSISTQLTVGREALPPTALLTAAVLSSVVTREPEVAMLTTGRSEGNRQGLNLLDNGAFYGIPQSQQQE